MNGYRPLPAPPARRLTDEQIREAHEKYMTTSRGLRPVAKEYGISHVQLAAGFVRLGLQRRGNRCTDPEVIERVISMRGSGEKWTTIAESVNLSLRQVQNVYSSHAVGADRSGPANAGRDSAHAQTQEK